MAHRLMTVYSSTSYNPFARALNRLAESKDDFEHVWSFWDTTNKYKVLLSTKPFKRSLMQTMRGQIKLGLFGKRYLGDSTYTASSTPMTISPRLRSVLLEAFTGQRLRYASSAQYRHKLKGHSDYINYLQVLADATARKMDEHGITHVVFFDHPDLAMNRLIYELAQEKGIETIILTQYFQNKIFSTRKIEDFGVFNWIDKPGSANTVDDHEFTPLLLDEAWQSTGPRGQLNARMYANILKFLVMHDPLTLFRFSRLSEVIGRAGKCLNELPTWRRTFERDFNYPLLDYHEQLAKLEKEANTYLPTLIEKNRPYVYVPLNKQAEMKPFFAGGTYRDQLLMIEQLDNLLPEGWDIVVKENPTQGTFNRESTYFHRLQRMQSVHFAPTDANSKLLIKNAKVVATVFGTSSLEAVQMGVPTVTFGKAWYNCLPGITRFSKDIDLEKIASKPVDIDEVRRVASMLMKRRHHGSIGKMERWYHSPADKRRLRTTRGLSKEENAKQVANLIYDLLTGKVPFSFGNSA